jgi:predicted nucleic acid-binding protein
VGAPLITLDSSAIFSLLDRREPGHERTLAAFEDDGGPYLVPAGILAEAAYLVERWLGSHVLDAFLADLEDGTLTLNCGDGDLTRIRELAVRYADLPLGFADACVAACAERHGGRVLTLDRRDFDVLAREGTLTILPTV